MLLSIDEIVDLMRKEAAKPANAAYALQQSSLLARLLSRTPREVWKARSHRERFRRRYGRDEAPLSGYIGEYLGVRFGA